MKKLYSTFSLLLALLSVTAQDKQQTVLLKPTVIQVEYLGETVALRDFVVDPTFPNEITKENKIGYHPKKRWSLYPEINPNALPKGMDPALQNEYARPAADDRGLVLSFNGMGNTNVSPADPSLDVGPNHVIQMINGGSGGYFRIWNKAGTQVQAQTYFDTFFGQPGGAGDPIVMYDELANRWFMSEFTSTGNRFSIAVSSSPDPLGTWYKYIFTAPNFPDYPKYAIWNNAYIITSNENSPAVYAIDRTTMLTGGASTTAQRFTLNSFGTIGFQAATPVSLNGTTLPPTGTPAYVMRMRDDSWGATSDALEMWAFNINWSTPANTSLTQVATLPIAAFNSSLCGYTSFSCVPQPNSATTLDPLREVLMNRIHYRNFGTHESIVCCHAADVDGNDKAGIRWYELRRIGGTSGTWSIYQQATYSPDANHRWMSSIGISASGNIGLAYNVSSSTVFPSLRYTGRRSCDPLNTMTEPETVIVAGTASNNSNRYGDYNQLGLDPTDGETFWFTGMYNPAASWSTRVASFTIPACAASVQFSNSTFSVNESSANVNNNCLDYVVVNIPISIGTAPTQTTTATVNITGGTATNNVDYLVATPMVTFNSTTTTGNIVIHVYNDDYVEGNETITLAYTLNSNGGNAQTGTLNQTTTVTINDDDLVPSLATVPTTVFTQNFNSGLAPFTTVNPSGNTPWQVGTAAAASTTPYTVPATNTSQFAWINDDACNCTQANVDLKSAVFSLVGYTGAVLTFDAFFLGNTWQNVTESATVKISTNGGTTFTNIYTLPGNTAWASYSINLTPYIGNTNVMIAFNYGDGGGFLYGCSIDNVVVTGQASVGIQTAVNTAAPDQAYLGPNGTVYFFDPTTAKVMMKIQNNSSFDYGCVDAMVDRQGTTPTTVAFSTNNTADYLMSKTFKVVPTNNSESGNYTITLYYKENEVAAWETATGNSRNSIEMVKVNGNTSAIAAVTPANFGTYAIVDLPATLGAFGTDVTFTSTFTNEFSGFGMGIYNAAPIAPISSFTAPSSACVNTAVSLTNTSTGTPTSYLWNFGDGQTSTLANPTHIYATAGTYTVTLTVSNAAGNNTTTSIVVIQAAVTYYADADGDGFGNSAVSIAGCSVPFGYVASNTDCNDAASGINPSAIEICNAADENCNGLIDEGIATNVYYADIDGDGFGNPNISVSNCAQPVGYIQNNLDCADNLASVNPIAMELCSNNIDDDCNGLIDDANAVSIQQNYSLCQGEFILVGNSTYDTAGTYTDLLIAANGCDSTVTTTIAVTQYPTVTLSTTANILCSNYMEVAQLTGTPAGGVFGSPATSTGLINAAAVGNGVYDITYTYDMNGCSTTEMVAVEVQTCAGVEENSLARVVAYPSPANDNISFKGLEPGAPIELFDVTGRLVYSSKVNRDVVTLNVKNYAEGVYTLKSTKAGKAGSLSFLVKH